MRTSSATTQNNNDNDLFSDDNVQASMMDLSKGMQKLMVNFQNCTERANIGRSGSNVISDHIRDVKRLRDTFRKFVKDSLEFNDRLSYYSLYILFFVRCFNDDQYSDDDRLQLTNDLLEKSRENHGLTIELKNRIKTDDDDEDGSGINDKLTKIQNSLPGRIEDIKQEINRDKLSALIPKGDGLASAMTRYVISLFFDVKHLYRKLDDIITIKDFDESLRSIILDIGKIETFWDMQTKRIEYLIENLRSGRDIQCHPVVYALEKNWKNVEKECQIYNRVMMDLLNKDRLICIGV